MQSKNVSEQEWLSFLDVADRLQIPVRALLEKDVRFAEMEAAGHQLGRAVARIATERLALARAERMTEAQCCPTCGKRRPLHHQQREIDTIDGPVELREPVCHCSACRRDFFPSASHFGT
jgi:hypothetical protein